MTGIALFVCTFVIHMGQVTDMLGAVFLLTELHCQWFILVINKGDNAQRLKEEELATSQERKNHP
jgi:hypothetical protein